MKHKIDLSISYWYLVERAMLVFSETSRVKARKRVEAMSLEEKLKLAYGARSSAEDTVNQSSAFIALAEEKIAVEKIAQKVLAKK